MKPISAFLAFLITFLMPLTHASALEKGVPVDSEGFRATYGFQLQVLGADDRVKPECDLEGDRKVTAKAGERYTIRVYNPLPVRAAVNLTVDGVNTIDGKPCGVEDGSRWMVEPMSWITIRGWQVNGGEARRFYFTNAKRSYAAWRGAALKKDLTANCGVIGAAFFWNRAELASWQQEQARMRCDRMARRNASGASCAMKADMAQLAAPAAAKEKAGTGMGERETHLVRAVEFRGDAGMFDPKNALVLYYGFEEPTRPNPFPALSYAPEVP